ncbi:MAG: adenine phosphoribosyltransferase [Malacoplasma sp.]|nr:adenine phosphoribosyltransferase [Malacoplasma sp.]
MDYQDIKNSIITIEDFPKKGISFKDISPLFLDPKKVEFVIDEMANFAKTIDFDCIVAPESRGFLFGLPLALKMKKPFVLVRKKGKLPREVVSESYNLEYGVATLEITKDAVAPNSKALIVDDLIATGGTTIAIQNILTKLNVSAVGQVYLIELFGLADHSKLQGKFFSLIKM